MLQKNVKCNPTVSTRKAKPFEKRVLSFSNKKCRMEFILHEERIKKS